MLGDVIYNKKKIMGHSFILLGMLTGNKFWKHEYNEKKINEISVPKIN